MKKLTNWLSVFLLGIICFFVYSNSINTPFIFDDNHMIVENLFITQFKYTSKFFSGFVSSYTSQGMCRPLLMLTFTFNYLTGKLNPSGYHIVNLLFHFLNSYLLFYLLKYFKPNISPNLRLLISLLFVVHPLNTEAVTYISSRSDLMVTSFILFGFILYLKNKLFLAAIAYIAALLTKETGLCLPFLLFGYFSLYQYKKNHISQQTKKMGYFIIFALISVTYIFFNVYYFKGLNTSHIRPFYSNFLIQSWVSFLYLKLFLYPSYLCLLRDTPELTSLFQIEALAPVLSILGLILLVFLLRKKNTLISLGIFWYLTCLLPKFYATLKVPASEHHFYLPSIGIYILLIPILNKFYSKNKRVFLYSAAALLISFSLLTMERNSQFKNTSYFWEDGTKKEPNHIGNWINLAMSLKKENRLLKEKEILTQALNIPDKGNQWKVQLYILLSEIYALEKNYPKCIDTLLNALKLRPDNDNIFKIYLAAGKVSEITGKKETAIKIWERTLQISPSSWTTYNDLSRLYIEKGQLEKAKKYLDKSLQINSYNYYSYFLLGKIYEKENIPKAIYCYKKSIDLKSDWFHSHYTLSLLYAFAKDPLALEELKKALLLNPEFKPPLSLYPNYNSYTNQN